MLMLDVRRLALAAWFTSSPPTCPAPLAASRARVFGAGCHRPVHLRLPGVTACVTPTSALLATSAGSWQRPACCVGQRRGSAALYRHARHHPTPPPPRPLLTPPTPPPLDPTPSRETRTHQPWHCFCWALRSPALPALHLQCVAAVRRVSRQPQPSSSLTVPLPCCLTAQRRFVSFQLLLYFLPARLLLAAASLAAFLTIAPFTPCKIKRILPGDAILSGGGRGGRVCKATGRGCGSVATQQKATAYLFLI
jgi:hypothetical protein